MSVHYYNISENEMREFLESRGFQQMSLPGTTELVFGKIVKQGTHRLSLRVYTAINPSGESRKCGKDAIRVQLYFMYDGKPQPVGKSQTVKRIKTWQKNLENALKNHSDDENFRICPACNYPMVQRIRRSDKQKFWGCVTFFKTKCSGKSSHFAPDNISSSRKSSDGKIPSDKLTVYQKNIEELFLESTNHIMIGALAGSGKTAMCLHLSTFRKAEELWQYIVFNKKNAAEGRRKFERGVPVQTQHSFDARWIRKALPDMPRESTPKKTYRLLEEIYPAMSNDNRRRVRSAIFKLIPLAKAYACRPGDIETISAVMNNYTFEISQEEGDTVVEIANKVLEASLPHNCGNTYTYDDLLWWPVVLDLEVPKFDIVLADECQDFNRCQHDRIKRLAEAGARIIAVGDRNQAVYRFRGADNDSFDNLKTILAGTSRGVVEAELPDNFRCGTKHIEYVQKNTCVGTKIKAHSGAAEGKVITDMNYNDIIEFLISEG